MTACHFCGDPIDPTGRQTWRRVEGWERKATAAARRSGSDIALRQPRDEYAHDLCVSRARSGLSPLQGSLL